VGTSAPTFVCLGAKKRSVGEDGAWGREREIESFELFESDAGAELEERRCEAQRALADVRRYRYREVVLTRISL